VVANVVFSYLPSQTLTDNPKQQRGPSATSSSCHLVFGPVAESFDHHSADCNQVYRNQDNEQARDDPTNEVACLAVRHVVAQLEEQVAYHKGSALVHDLKCVA
jgi:hypothetical protein